MSRASRVVSDVVRGLGWLFEGLTLDDGAALPPLDIPEGCLPAEWAAWERVQEVSRNAKQE